MASKILVVLFTAILFFLAYRYFIEGFQIHPSIFNDTTVAPQVLPERAVSSGGPSPPNAMPKESMSAIMAESEAPNDPYDQTDGQTPMQDSMRYPERSFGPAGQNSITDIAAESGIASRSVQNTQNSARVFSPEFSQNGGYVSDEVVANDTFDDMSYSAF
jgi:hypothetical protein